ncbi:hypothetical protein G4B88_006847 [Cannabis sativa]|uniref:Phospholipase D n=1 Tax=Cannabis sativa TaxID=3483 RepID=A0A7J6G3Y7_CANSA|nr:hypothetical protein G4B88_006847 [Cannabis sativa]
MADPDSSEVIYLHGDLDLHIIGARSLPNMDVVSDHFRRCVTGCGTIKYGRSSKPDPNESSDGGKPHRRIITSDPYVTVNVPQATVARTRVIKNAREPKWDEKFTIALAHPLVNLEFMVKDDDLFGADLIGTAKIPALDISSGKTISGWFPICGYNGNPPKPDTAIHLEMKFTRCEENPLYLHGVAGDPEEKGVRQTYFPVRKGSSVKLYQDAHVSDEMLPRIELDGGKVFTQEKCWEDICYAISEAHHMIYLVGWSIYHKVKLVREPTRPLPRGGDLTLGDLLKYKSEEGVRVLLLVWDDKTSHDAYLINTAGVMATHDEETKKFFKHSSVICVLAPRYGSSKMSYIKQQVVGTVFTHHQKCVLVDTQADRNNRRITAFLGGIDLCDGRYDTPQHRLFRDLDTVFKDDFHNPTFPAGTKAPRQPWHDLHCRIDGPAAYDVLINFEQRWRKSTKWTGTVFCKKVAHWHDDSMIKIGRISWILSPSMPESKTSKDKAAVTIVPEDDKKLWVSTDNESWHVQIMRSIDQGSVKGFPKVVKDAVALEKTKLADDALLGSQNLICAKNQVIDRSIQSGYIQAIRSAQHFIYIENQYFVGSSYGWPDYKNAGADNLIPMELALKIASKIRANERFAVYCVIPMWPEGDPKSAPVQEILYWQSQTMQMMYEVIAKALKAAKSDLKPEDYLNFYCLGNREDFEEVQSSTDTAVVSESQNRMIVDDEYVIIGSANINQRSLAGTKDTELAMGSYQPYHTWARRKRHPRGQIYGYRMSLWAEHLGKLDHCFEEPENLDCVKMVNDIAIRNWNNFMTEEFTPLQGHLLKYPLHVNEDGKVVPLSDCDSFPDVGGKIIGAHSATLPDVLTT